MLSRRVFFLNQKEGRMYCSFYYPTYLFCAFPKNPHFPPTFFHVHKFRTQNSFVSPSIILLWYLPVNPRIFRHFSPNRLIFWQFTFSPFLGNISFYTINHTLHQHTRPRLFLHKTPLHFWRSSELQRLRRKRLIPSEPI